MMTDPSATSSQNSVRSGVADVHLIRVMCADELGGAPVAVVPNASAIPPVSRQGIAARVGVPDTVFLDGGMGDIIHTAFYAPGRHARLGDVTAIAAAWHHFAGLRAGLRPLRCRTITGLVQIGILSPDMLSLRFSAPTLTAVDGAVWNRLATDTGSNSGPNSGPSPRQGTGRGAVIADNGQRFLLAPVRDAAGLASLTVDPVALSDLCSKIGVCGVYFHVRPDTVGGAVAARFARPGASALDDIATMPAAAALAGYLCSDQVSSQVSSAGVFREKAQTGGEVEDIAFDVVQGKPDQPDLSSRMRVRHCRSADGVTTIDVGGACQHGGGFSFSW